MCLHTRILHIIHRLKEARHDSVVLLSLQIWREVRAQLTKRLEARPPHARVLVNARGQAHVNAPVALRRHHLGASLRDLSEADHARVPLLPVGLVRQKVWKQSRCDWKHLRTTQRERHAVESLLADVVCLAVTRILVAAGTAVGIGPGNVVPLGVVVDVEQEEQKRLEEIVDEIGKLADHARSLVARLRERHEKLHGKLSCRRLELLRARERGHSVCHLHEHAAQESRVHLRNLDEHLERILRSRFVLFVQRRLESREHVREQRLEA